MAPHPLSRLRRAAMVLALSLAAAIAFTIWVDRHLPPPPVVVVSGTADVGSPFRLTDQNGRVVTDADYRGRTLVIYFGWALDPDLTPAALQVLRAAVDRLGPKSQSLAAVFISLDPERDTPEAIGKFLNKIGHNGAGLVGMPAEIIGLTRAFKLYHKRIPDASLPGGYSIDHASLYYVLGVDGGFRGTVPHTTNVQDLADELRRLAN